MSADSPPKQGRSLVERFLSTSFNVEAGTRVDPAAVRGYPVDFRVKAQSRQIHPSFRAKPGFYLWVGAIQRGLGCYERYLAGEGDAWLESARDTAELLVEVQRDDGAWAQVADYPHTFDISAPWVSGMAQGEGASLLVRLHAETGDDRYAEAALRAVALLARPVADGGASAELDGALVPEEYPTHPSSHVLNGLVFGMWGLRDVGVALGDADATRRFDAAVDAVARSIGRWDIGYWSTYDLYPHPIRNVASPAYHYLHVVQLEATNAMAPRPRLAEAADRFRSYAESPVARARAFARKAAFRVAVPRNARVARAVPWSRRGRA